MAADQQFWGSSVRGGYLANDRLSSQLRHALTPLCKFRQFVGIKEGWGKGVGDTVKFDKISKISTAGGTLIETNVMPSRAFAIDTGVIILSEYGNAIPYTGKLEALAEFDPTMPIQRVLRDDMKEVLDKACGLQFKLTQVKYIASSTVIGAFETIAAGKTLGSSRNAKGGWRIHHIEDVVASLKTRNIPKYDGENYMSIASVNFLREIRKDSSWTDAAKYGDPERLFAGEVGRISGVRFVEETNYLINTLGTGGNFGEAVIFGQEAVMEGIAVPEELRAKTPTDYGRSKGLAWYGIMGWKKMWASGDTNQDEHIIHLTSKT